MKRIILSLLLSVALCGCAGVPATHVTVNPKTGAIDIQSPKEIAMSNVVVTIHGPDVSVNIGSYQSKNSPDVLATVAGANASMLATSSALLDKLAATAAAAAVKSAVPVP